MVELKGKVLQVNRLTVNIKDIKTIQIQTGIGDRHPVKLLIDGVVMEEYLYPKEALLLEKIYIKNLNEDIL